MATIRRLTNSCLTVTDDAGTTLFDPGFWTFDSGEFDLEAIGDVQRILITHEHGDHVKPEFVRWLLDRGTDVTVHTNQAVVDLLAKHDIDASTEAPAGCSVEDVLHGRIPTGLTPPNRSWTIDGLLTHPGDSQEPRQCAPVLALPLIAPWTSTTDAVAFAKRLGPSQVVPIHDFYLSASGRQTIMGMAARVLDEFDIEVVPLDWGDSYTV